MGKHHIPPCFGPFWGHSRTLPQGVELLVYPIVTSLFCSINTSPNEFLVQTPPSHHLKPIFLLFGGLWGGQKCQKKMTPLFFGS